MNTISKEKRKEFNYRKTALYTKYSKHCNPGVHECRDGPGKGSEAYFRMGA